MWRGLTNLIVGVAAKNILLNKHISKMLNYCFKGFIQTTFTGKIGKGFQRIKCLSHIAFPRPNCSPVQRTNCQPIQHVTESASIFFLRHFKCGFSLGIRPWQCFPWGTLYWMTLWALCANAAMRTVTAPTFIETYFNFLLLTEKQKETDVLDQTRTQSERNICVSFLWQPKSSPLY